MKEKIINIRNILKIIISLFVIFTMIRSCSKAYTYDDFISFVGQVKDLNHSASWNYYCNTILNNQNNLRNAIGNGFVSFVVQGQNNTSGNIRILVWSSSMTLSISRDSYWNITSLNLGTPVSTNTITLGQDGNYYIQSGTRNNQLGNNDFGLIESNSNISNWYDLKFQNIYIPAPAVNFTQLGKGAIQVDSIQNVQKFWLNSATKLGYISNYGDSEISLNTTFKFEQLLPDNVTNDLTEDCNIWYDGGQIYWYIGYNDWLQWHKLYRLTIYYENENIGEYYYYAIDPFKDENLANGSIINYGWTSGDFEFDIQDQTQAIINNQNQINEDNKNWVMETFFSIDSGDVQEVITGIIQNTNINNMGLLEEISGELSILTGEPSDFVIRWNNATYQNEILIPSGEINFSQKVRETPALQSVLDWAHIIIGYTTISLLIMEIWFTFCKILGVSVSFYDQQQDELNTIDEYQNDFYDADTGILTRDLVRKRKGYVQTIRTRKDFKGRK